MDAEALGCTADPAHLSACGPRQVIFSQTIMGYLLYSRHCSRLAEYSSEQSSKQEKCLLFTELTISSVGRITKI